MIFGKGTKKSLRKLIKEMDPDINDAVQAIYVVEAGAPRAILHCDEADLGLLHGFIPRLRAEDLLCDVYKEQRGARRGPERGSNPKARQADHGLRAAGERAGTCHYMDRDEHCPHNDTPAGCKFICYGQGGQARSQRRQATRPQRRQPSGWRR